MRGRTIERFVGELIDLLRIPSISTDPAYSQNVADAAGWLTVALRDIGVKNAVSTETEGHPIVTGEVHVDRCTSNGLGVWPLRCPTP